MQFINPSNAELNPICHLLALLGSHPILHVSRISFKIMWKNTVELGRKQMKIRRMRIACWQPRATNTHSGCVILIAFLLQQWFHGPASMLRYTYEYIARVRSESCRIPGTWTLSSSFYELRIYNHLIGFAAICQGWNTISTRGRKRKCLVTCFLSHKIVTCYRWNIVLVYFGTSDDEVYFECKAHYPY
jgi:hypothetical protein